MAEDAYVTMLFSNSYLRGTQAMCWLLHNRLERLADCARSSGSRSILAGWWYNQKIGGDCASGRRASASAEDDFATRGNG